VVSGGGGVAASATGEDGVPVEPDVTRVADSGNLARVYPWMVRGGSRARRSRSYGFGGLVGREPRDINGYPSPASLARLVEELVAQVEVLKMSLATEKLEVIKMRSEYLRVLTDNYRLKSLIDRQSHTGCLIP
jgi:hypothetical protein